MSGAEDVADFTQFPGMTKAEKKAEMQRQARLAADKEAKIPAFNIANTTKYTMVYWPGHDAAVLPGQAVTVPEAHRARIQREAKEYEARGEVRHGRTGDIIPPPFRLTTRPAQTVAEIHAIEAARLEAMKRK